MKKKTLNLDTKYKGLWKVWIHQIISLMFRNVQIWRVAGDILLFSAILTLIYLQYF